MMLVGAQMSTLTPGCFAKSPHMADRANPARHSSVGLDPSVHLTTTVAFIWGWIEQT